MNARQLLGFAIAFSVASLPATAQESALPIRGGDRVVLLGGGFISGERDFGYLEARLSRPLADANLVVRNLGWPGDNVRGLARTGGFKNPDGIKRLVKEVAELKPTILIIGYGMNESFDGPEGLAGFHKDYRQLLAQLAPLKARIVLLSPTCHEDFGPPWPNPTQHNQDLEQYTAVVEKIAGEEKAIFVDLFHPLALAFKKDAKMRWTTNGIQLNSHGYAQAARIVEGKLGLKPFPDVLEIDAAGKVMPLEGRVIDQIKASPDGIRFQVSDSLLAVPGDTPTLRVTGLKPGKYRIQLDGRVARDASEAELAMGAAMPTNAPPLAAGAEWCRKIAYKNDLFYRRWRPFNDHSRHWDFIGGDFQLWEKQVADQEKIIAQSRRPRAYVVEIVREP
jgi:hypothetical protein